MATLTSPARVRSTLPPRGRTYSNPGALAARLLTNSFEGGTNTTTITTGNSGGTSGNAFDVVNFPAGGTVTFDNTHAAHGSLACELATAGTAGVSYAGWTTSMGFQSKVWFRLYLYFTANPAAALVVFAARTGAGPGGGVQISTAGKVQMVNAAGSGITTSTLSIPLGAWFRVEGFVLGSATVGQTEMKLFYPADAQVPVETDTSAASQGTGGTLSVYRFGMGQGNNTANAGPWWMDDIGLSNTGYLGPVSFPGPASLGKPARARIPARVRGGGGLVVSNQHTPPYVPPRPSPAAPAVDASPLPSLITTFPGYM